MYQQRFAQKGVTMKNETKIEVARIIDGNTQFKSGGEVKIGISANNPATEGKYSEWDENEFIQVYTLDSDGDESEIMLTKTEAKAIINKLTELVEVVNNTKDPEAAN
jgi:hypothetical protein